MSHALAAGDVEGVVRVVEGNALAMMDHGELTTMVGWLDALPDEVVRSRPWLGVARAWGLTYVGQFDAVEPLLQDAENALAGLEGAPKTGIEGLALSEVEESVLSRAEVRHIAGHIAAIRAYGAWISGQGAHAVERAREALELLPEENLMSPLSSLLSSSRLYKVAVGQKVVVSLVTLVALNPESTALA